MNGKYKNLWSKSGAVVCRQEGDHFYPVKLKETYWMYWGESDIYAATSDDLIHWTPVEFLADGADPSLPSASTIPAARITMKLQESCFPSSAPESATMMNFCASRALRQS